jgi:exopolyphosphatase/guanosine-5'-triphosphate,3'-diphosphate pyrophosphatase
MSSSACPSAPRPLTERFGLAGIVSDEALAAALEGIGDELDCLDDRSSPDLLVGMEGAVTNLAAVEHALAALRPGDRPRHSGRPCRGRPADPALSHPHGRRTPRRRGAFSRTAPKVMLAGACVVRTVLTKLGCELLVVSDRGLRQGLIADRVALGLPVG